MKPQPTGYSGTPLAKKLGITAGCQVVTKNAPDNYTILLEPLPEHIQFGDEVTQHTGIVHVFCLQRSALTEELQKLRNTIKRDGVVWVSWPKKASKVPTDITEDTIREVALPLGLVDVKVCAVSDVWSGLKLVIRKTLR